MAGEQLAAKNGVSVEISPPTEQHGMSSSLYGVTFSNDSTRRTVTRAVLATDGFAW